MNKDTAGMVEELALKIAAYPAHETDMGPDNEVIGDRVSPDHGQSIGEIPGPIHRLAAEIVADLLSAEGGEGWVSVPREPTREMIEAVISRKQRRYIATRDMYADIYRAMIQASPSVGGGKEDQGSASQKPDPIEPRGSLPTNDGGEGPHCCTRCAQGTWNDDDLCDACAEYASRFAGGLE